MYQVRRVGGLQTVVLEYPLLLGASRLCSHIRCCRMYEVRRVLLPYVCGCAVKVERLVELRILPTVAPCTLIWTRRTRSVPSSSSSCERERVSRYVGHVIVAHVTHVVMRSAARDVAHALRAALPDVIVRAAVVYALSAGGRKRSNRIQCVQSRGWEVEERVPQVCLHQAYSVSVQVSVEPRISVSHIAVRPVCGDIR